MKTKEFVVLNAFALKPFGGNPAAVFPDARGIPEEQLQPIARQLNLIETVFAYPAPKPGVHYRLRYFTPLKELPIAGHPTIAAWSAFVLRGILSVAGRATFVQESGAGQQEVTVVASGSQCSVEMKQPPPTYSDPYDDVVRIAESIGLQPDDIDRSLPVQGVSVGLGHVVVPVRNLAVLARAKMNIPKVQEVCSSLGMREMQLFTFETYDPTLDLFTRNFTPREGLEDPACGNVNGALGAYLARTKFRDSEYFHLKAEQGHLINMPSLIEISVSHTAGMLPEVSIAGSAIAMVEGRVLVQ